MKNMPRFVMLSKILGIRQANFCDIVQRNMYVKNYKVSCTRSPVYMTDWDSVTLHGDIFGDIHVGPISHEFHMSVTQYENVTVQCYRICVHIWLLLKSWPLKQCCFEWFVDLKLFGWSMFVYFTVVWIDFYVLSIVMLSTTALWIGA